ncbi:AcrR family transcriptional regulator [Bradyrhizobium sp. GM5.1]
MIRNPASKETARKPNMREAILAAAEELFATNGFNAVSVRDIAQAAGANPGSVTYHFKTKDGLLLEIYRRHCGPMNLPPFRAARGRQARARSPGPARSGGAGLCRAGLHLGQ